MDGYDFHAPLTADGLISEVAAGTFAFKNKVKLQSVRLLWEKMGFFVAETMKQQKGVLLPNLGNFRVGPVVGESVKKIRPSFTLLEGRYGAVSQERPKYMIGGKAPIVQPNYGLLSSSAGVHRGAGQRLIAELLQRLGVHILSLRPIKVEFPYVGRLVTNRAGRIDFVFHALLSEYFEKETYAIVKEMQYSPRDYDYDVVKGLQHVHLSDPPLMKSPRGMSRPLSALSAASKREHMRQQSHAPYTGALSQLLKLCEAADRTASACVPRLRLEQWLHQECRSLLVPLNGATLLDLLDRHTYGKTSQQIMYRQFLDSLDAALASETGAQPQVREAASHDVDRGSPLGATLPQTSSLPEQGQQLRAEASAQDLIQQSPVEVSPSEPDSYIHYCQHQLSPRSRADYDAFNRVHFEHLDSARGSRLSKRAVTPKVGEEPLNVQEYQAVRSASPRAAHVGTPGMPPSQQQRWATPISPGFLLARHAPQQQAPQQPQVWRITGDSPDHVPHKAPGQKHDQGYDILAPTPLLVPRPGSTNGPLSQYDIMRQPDPAVRAQLKAEYAAELQQGWQKQIQEKEELQGVLQEKESEWPFGPVGVPMDKRPVSAISRPWAPVSPPRSPRRTHSRNIG